MEEELETKYQVHIKNRLPYVRPGGGRQISLDYGANELLTEANFLHDSRRRLTKLARTIVSAKALFFGSQTSRGHVIFELRQRQRTMTGTL
jgi:hypothetical protein